MRTTRGFATRGRQTHFFRQCVPEAREVDAPLTERGGLHVVGHAGLIGMAVLEPGRADLAVPDRFPTETAKAGHQQLGVEQLRAFHPSTRRLLKLTRRVN